MLLLCVVTLVVARPAPASAHARLVATSPADGASLTVAPEQVELTFDEAVAPVDDGTRLLVAGQDPVVLEATSRDAVVTAALPELPADARVVVAWRVVSSDGHPLSGLLTFTVGSPSADSAAAADDDLLETLEPEAPTWVPTTLAVANAAWYLGLLLVAGAALFVALCLPRTGSGAPRPRRRLDVTLVAVAVVGALASVPLQASRVAGEVTPGPADWLDLAGGRHVAAALVSSVLLVVLVLLLRPPRRPRLAAVLAVLALATPVLTGHSAAEEPTWLMAGADVVHLVAGAVWLGGVVALVRYLRARTGPAADAAAVVRRFSVLAAASVAALVVTGTVMAWIVLPSFDALTSTSYGRLLVLKVAVAAVPVGMAAWNRTHLGAARPGGSRDDWTSLLRTVRREATLLVTVVVVTGVLVLQSPTGHDHDAAAAPGTSASPAAPTREVRGTAEGVVVRATVDPAGTTGESVLRFDVLDDAGEPLDLVAPPTLDVSLPDEGIGPARTEAGATTTGYVATLQTPTSGTWQVVVGVRLSQFEQRSVLLRVVVASP